MYSFLYWHKEYDGPMWAVGAYDTASAIECLLGLLNEEVDYRGER